MSVPVFEFDLGGRKWQSKRLEPFVQAFMMKRIAPLVGPIIPLMMAAKKDDLSPEMALEILEKNFPAFAEGIGSLKDDDLGWLMETSLGTLKMFDENAKEYMPFWNKATRQAMYSDLFDLSLTLPLTIQVIRENLTPFFATMATNRKAPTTPPTTG